MAAKNKIRCPGKKGTKVPTNPSANKQAVTTHAATAPITGKLSTKKSTISTPTPSSQNKQAKPALFFLYKATDPL